VVLTFVDITETRKAERAKAEAHQRTNDILESISDAFYTVDADFRFKYVNRKAEELWGRKRDTLLGKHYWSEFPQVVGTEVYQHHLRAMSDRRAVNFETQSPLVNGWMDVSIYPNDQGGLSVYFRDITARKAAAAALRSSEERLRLIVENAREYAIFAMDLQRTVTRWNAGAQRLLGYGEAEILGVSGDVIFTPEDKVKGAPELECATALAEGRAADERWHVRKDGSRFWGDGVMMAMQDGAGQTVGFVKIFRDHSDRRAAQEAIERSHRELAEALAATEQARAAAEAAGQAKDRFLAVLSHELRTPLTPIMMTVRTLARRKDAPEYLREPLETIQRNAQIEARLIDDLLDVTKIGRGKLEIVREPVNLAEVLKHAVHVCSEEFEAKQQQFSAFLEMGEATLAGDALRLQQVFWNLLKNASKFTPEGGTVSLVARKEAGRLRVEVRDTGIGFPPDAGARIFDPFVQANDSISRIYGGLGLGLAICKAAVEAHGGTIRAESGGEGTGAVFTVELPVEGP
jgi:two-component system CheB/CheR fusion protein